MRVAKVNLSAAITREGASRCANLIKIEAVETANKARIIAKGRIRRARCSFIGGRLVLSVVEGTEVQKRCGKYTKIHGIVRDEAAPIKWETHFN